jgi:hypothetical protein
LSGGQLSGGQLSGGGAIVMGGNCLWGIVGGNCPGGIVWGGGGVFVLEPCRTFHVHLFGHVLCWYRLISTHGQHLTPSSNSIVRFIWVFKQIHIFYRFTSCSFFSVDISYSLSRSYPPPFPQPPREFLSSSLHLLHGRLQFLHYTSSEIEFLSDWYQQQQCQLLHV